MAASPAHSPTSSLWWPIRTPDAGQKPCGNPLLLLPVTPPFAGHINIFVDKGFSHGTISGGKN
jgi:hypothetical protein